MRVFHFTCIAPRKENNFPTSSGSMSFVICERQSTLVAFPRQAIAPER